IWSSGRRMVEDVPAVYTERNASRLSDSESLLQIRIDIPAAGAVDRVEAQRAQLTGRCILQNDVLTCCIGCDSRVGAERCKVGRDLGARRIGHTVQLLRKVIAELVAPDHLAAAREVADDIRRSGAVDGGGGN